MTASILPRRGLLSAYLCLIRPANLVSAAADSLSGWAVAGGRDRGLGWLIGASICLYAGGVVLNDVFDRRLDAIERPERPLPSGTIPVVVAAVMGVFFLIAGIMAGFQVSPYAGAIASLIACLAVFYDAIAKHLFVGPVVMGTCRALNLLLGLSVALPSLKHMWFLMLLPLIYIAAITMLSRGEVHGGSRAVSGTVLALFCLLVGALLTLHIGNLRQWLSVLPFALLLTLRVAPSLVRAWRNPEARTIRSAVHAGIVSLIVLDAAIVAGYGGLILAAAILSLTVVAADLGRLFPVS